MVAVTSIAAVKAELALTAAPDDLKLSNAVAAAIAYVSRYHEEPAADAPWPADYQLGAAKLAAGLYRDANSPGIGEAFGISNDSAFRRATDVQIEQLLRIGRFALPGVG